jgi:trimethylamine:corrinoid methyltransferase-like protein
MSHDRWLQTGGLDVTEKARRRALELLATHEVPALPADLPARLDAVVAGL